MAQSHLRMRRANDGPDSQRLDFRTKSRRHWYAQPRTWIETVFVVVVAIALVDYSSTVSLLDKLVQRPTPSIPTVPHIGQVASDGNFSFTVQNMRCESELRLVGPPERAAPGTQWCVVTVAVARIKTVSGEFMFNAQNAITASGDLIPVDDAALHYITTSQALASKTIEISDLTVVKPGASFMAILPFNILSTDKIVSLRLDDSIFDNGVAIDMTQ